MTRLPPVSFYVFRKFNIGLYTPCRYFAAALQIWPLVHMGPASVGPSIRPSIDITETLGARSKKLRLLGKGVAVLPAALNLEQQQQLLLDSMNAMTARRASGVHLGNKQPPNSAWCYDNESRAAQQRRPLCLDYAQELFGCLGQQHRLGALFEADNREQSRSLHLLPLVGKLTFQNVWARLYLPTDALGWHRDPYHNFAGWVCIINLGADVTVAWRHGGQGAMVHRARLASGDVIFFNGEILEHAIEQVHEGTCPPFFLAAMGESPHVLVGLQMRAQEPPEMLGAVPPRK